MMLCRNYSISQALRLYKPPQPSNGPRGLLLCGFLPFFGHRSRRELLLRYQDKEERAPAALRLRGAGGGCPQISGPR